MIILYAFLLIAVVVLALGWAFSKNSETTIANLKFDCEMFQAGRAHRDRVIEELRGQLDAVKKKLNHADARHAKILSEHLPLKDHLRRLGCFDLKEALSTSDNPVAQTPTSVQA